MRMAYLLALSTLVAAPFTVGVGEAQESEVDKVHACASIAEAGARLSCFDAAVAALKQAQAAGDVSVVSRARIQQAEKDAFGLGPAAQASAVTNAMASSSAAAPAVPAPELDVVKIRIVTAEQRRDGTYRFTLDNGQVWEQIDTHGLGRLPRGEIEGEIRRASMGSFMLKAGNRGLVRVKRIK